MSRPGVDGVFQMSQRADYINNDLYEWVQFNRSIINTRDEPLGDPRKFRRLHLLHGDTSVLPATLLLKVGTTSLMLDLLEINHLPKVVLADAVKTFRALSHQPEGPWDTRFQDGGGISFVAAPVAGEPAGGLVLLPSVRALTIETTVALGRGIGCWKK